MFLNHKPVQGTVSLFVWSIGSLVHQNCQNLRFQGVLCSLLQYQQKPFLGDPRAPLFLADLDLCPTPPCTPNWRKKNGGFVFQTFYDTPKTIHVSQRTFSCRTLLHCYCTLLFLSIGVRTVEAKVPVELTSKTVLPHSCACRELLEARGGGTKPSRTLLML